MFVKVVCPKALIKEAKTGSKMVFSSFFKINSLYIGFSVFTISLMILIVLKSEQNRSRWSQNSSLIFFQINSIYCFDIFQESKNEHSKVFESTT